MTPMLDALVVGAGPAGSHVAIQLARAGRDVVLVEREKQPVSYTHLTLPTSDLV